MALTKSIELTTGINVANAYLRVEGVSLTKTNMNFHIREYTEQGMPFFNEEVFNCSYNIEGDNPIKQAYLYLKTLPEFADATDV
jgi:hypothetical protein